MTSRPAPFRLIPGLPVVAVFLALALVDGVAQPEKTGAPATPLPIFFFPSPLPAVAAAATQAGLPLSGIDLTKTERPFQAGDAVIALVTLAGGKEDLQWIVQVASVQPTEKELSKTATPIRDVRFYSSTGNDFQFGFTRAALALRVIGPVRSKSGAREKSPVDKNARALTNLEFLALGFDRAAASMVRMRAEGARTGQSGGMPPNSLHFGFEPFPPELIAKSKPLAEKAGLTLDDERALVGTLPALLEFFQVVSKTPGLQEILTSVLDIPWWSLIRNVGKPLGVSIEYVSREMRELDPNPWPVPDLKIYALPFVLAINEKKALACQLAVVSPRVPLLASAGIIGITARRPDGKGPHLMIQVVATQRGHASVESRHSPR